MNITHLNTAKNLITKMANGDRWNDIRIRSFVIKILWNNDNKEFTDDRECLVNILNKTEQNHQLIKIENLINSCLSKHMNLLETIQRSMIYDESINKAIEFVEFADKEPTINDFVNAAASYIATYGLKNDNYTLKALIVNYHHVLVADRWAQSIKLVYETDDRVCHVNPYNLANSSFGPKNTNNNIMQDPKPIKKIIDNDESECKQTAPCEPSERYGAVAADYDGGEITAKILVDDVANEQNAFTNSDNTFNDLFKVINSNRKLTNDDFCKLRDLINQVKLLVGFQKDEIDRLKAANSQLSNVNELAALDLFKLKQINQKQEENIKLLRSANDNQAETIRELQLEAQSDNESLKGQLIIALAEHEKLVEENDLLKNAKDSNGEKFRDYLTRNGVLTLQLRNSETTVEELQAEITDLKYDNQNLIEKVNVQQVPIDSYMDAVRNRDKEIEGRQDLINSLTKELDEVAIERNGYRSQLSNYEQRISADNDVNIEILNRLAIAWNYDRAIRSHIIDESTDTVHSQALIKLFDLSHPIVIRNVEDIELTKGNSDVKLEYLKNHSFFMELSIINPNYFTVTTFDNCPKPYPLICEVPFENCLSNI